METLPRGEDARPPGFLLARLLVLEGAVRLHLKGRDPMEENSVFRIEVTTTLAVGDFDILLVGLESFYSVNGSACLQLTPFLDIGGNRHEVRSDNERLQTPIKLGAGTLLHIDYMRLMQPPTPSMNAQACEHGSLKLLAIIATGAPPTETVVESPEYRYEGARRWTELPGDA